MSTKTIIISLLGVILIGGAVYFSMSKNNDTAVTQNQPVTTTNTPTADTTSVTQEPTKDTSTDGIIDYIVDGQSGDEMRAAQTSLDAPLSTEAEPTINTNF